MRKHRGESKVLRYVLNKDIFLHKCFTSLQKAFINPPEPCEVLFMMDGCTLFCFKISTTIHCLYKACKSRDIFKYNSYCICLKEESQIHLGWLEGRPGLANWEHREDSSTHTRPTLFIYYFLGTHIIIFNRPYQ